MIATPSATAMADRNLSAFTTAVAADLDLIAGLHDRPLTSSVATAGREYPISDQLALALASPAAIAAGEALDASLSGLPAELDQATLDALAADHNDVYCRFAYRASPTESVWLTEDGLERQAPMFAVQGWYRRHGLRIEDGDGRPEDHIVHELGFLAHLVEHAGSAGDLEPAARFLDQHPLQWLGRLAERLEAARAPTFYAALAALTTAYLEELREHLGEITGIARPLKKPGPSDAETVRGREPTCGDPDERPFVPGAGPGW